MKKFLMVLCSMLLSVSLNVNAQSVANKVLSSLTFEAPKALYHAKGQKANMRAQPNAKARLVEANGGFSFIGRGLLVEDMGSNPNWVTTKVGGKTVYISKSVMVKDDIAASLPIVANLPYWWIEQDGDMDPVVLSWRVGKIAGNSQLYLCDLQTPDGRFYMLGKQVGSVLVFKYKIKVYVEDAIPEDMPVGKFSLESEVENGEKTYYLKVGKDKVKSFQPAQMGGEPEMGVSWFYDLSKFSEPMVHSLFKEVIEKNQTDMFYLTSFSFGKEWPHIF